MTMRPAVSSAGPSSPRPADHACEAEASGLAGAVWRKSTYSAVNGCVEVAFMHGQVAIRNAQDPQGQALLFTPTEWRAFIDGVRDGQFDLHWCGVDEQETSAVDGAQLNLPGPAH